MGCFTVANDQLQHRSVTCLRCQKTIKGSHRKRSMEGAMSLLNLKSSTRVGKSTERRHQQSLGTAPCVHPIEDAVLSSRPNDARPEACGGDHRSSVNSKGYSCAIQGVGQHVTAIRKTNTVRNCSRASPDPTTNDATKLMPYLRHLMCKAHIDRCADISN